MPAIQTIDINAYYGPKQALKNISLEIEEHSITAFIGPLGCGKSTFIRIFKRMNDYIEGFTMEGQVLIDEQDIYTKEVRVEELRQRVGMVFQKPNPFP